jgi:hypothetical protein
MCAVEREYGVHPFAQGACPSLYTEGISLYNVSKRNNHAWLSKSGVLFVLVAEIAHTPVNEFRKWMDEHHRDVANRLWVPRMIVKVACPGKRFIHIAQLP